MKLVRLTVVEMRRALHRRLVRWMIVLAVALSAAHGRDRLPHQPRPVRAGAVAGAPGTHVELVDQQRRRQLPDHGCVVPRRRGGDLRCLRRRGRVEGRHDHDGAHVGAVTRAPAHRPHRVGGDPRVPDRPRAGGRATSLSALPAVVLNGSAEGTDGAWWGALLLAMVRVALITALVAVLAVSIATIGRNTSAALIALAAWALVVERLVAGLRPQLARFMISENVATVVSWAQMDGRRLRTPADRRPDCPRRLPGRGRGDRHRIVRPEGCRRDVSTAVCEHASLRRLRAPGFATRCSLWCAAVPVTSSVLAPERRPSPG